MKRIWQWFHRLLVVAGASGLTLLLFLVLPLIQAICQAADPDTLVRAVDAASVPPPPPSPPPQEPEQDEEREETPPPELAEAPPLDLSQLELALDPGALADGVFGGVFAVRLDVAAASGVRADELFSVADLDQQPRPIFQPGPALSAEIRKRVPGQVQVLFVVDPQGRVESPVVQRSSDPVFERPALLAVKQWRFEPGRRRGQPVRFRMRVPITFPKGS